MNFVEITEWLKSTIPGIIILGAIGSIAGTFILWFTIKLFKELFRLLNLFMNRFVGEKLAKLFISYMRVYFKARAIFYQLTTKKSKLQLQILYQKTLADRNLIIIIAFIMLLITSLVFIFTGTTYPKTSVSLVALTIIFVHDSIFMAHWVRKMSYHFYGREEDIAKNTYADEDAVLLG
ncbi:hypothetical protein Q4519_07120 [Motilimonas sp. 1_MG-2023]|uniref:hypothetical protein n=1 Tax=Motilimonas sp. 1_MG-2023 TaxID=3062672 RepID=UPI0026E294F4|nr:hypothetical protein [Motilimonas sp. 1_MG-2023]MDO6525453.1 hypothetical protein [Motilimonas sp. 1_MG-2023]